MFPETNNHYQSNRRERSRRSHSVIYSETNKLHITVSQREGKPEEVSLCQCFQKPTDMHITVREEGWLMRSHSGNVSRNQQAPLVKEDGKKTRAHSANFSRNQLSFRQEGKVEEVSLYQCFQKPTSYTLLLVKVKGRLRRSHSPSVSRNQWSVREDGKDEEVSLCQCFQKSTDITVREEGRMKRVSLTVVFKNQEAYI